MRYVKVLFALPFLGCWYWFLVMLKPFFTDFLLFLSFSSDILLPLVLLAGTLILAALFHIVSGVLGNDWRIVLPQSILASILPLFVYPVPFALILAGGFLFVLTFTTMLVLHTVRAYFHFLPTKLFTPLVRKMATFVLIVASIGYFFLAQATIARDGFHIPEMILDTALSVFPNQDQKDATPIPTLPQLTAEQIAALKANPQFLAQFGLDPAILDTLEQSPQTEGRTPFSRELVKAALSAQVERILKPHYAVIPVILTLLFFVTLQSIASLIGLGIPPVLWCTFWILEKTGSITYTVEIREVKKLVI